MKIVCYNWKDIQHPAAGGAEVITHAILERYARDGHKVELVTARYPHASPRDKIHGVSIIRVGSNRYIHYIQAIWYFIRHHRGRVDLVIEEVNTVPYFLNALGGRKTNVVLFYHMLCKQIWYYQMPFIIAPFGYIAEYIYTRFQALISNKVITVSESTKNDLERHGFDPDNVSIIREAVPVIGDPVHGKRETFTVLFVSSLRPMKRPMDALKGFHMFHNKFPNSRMVLVGGGDQDVLRRYIDQQNLTDSVDLVGRVSEAEKVRYMQTSSILVTTSVKEGWGLIVSEAHSHGTPVVGYDVDGLRDAIALGEGTVVEASPQALAQGIAHWYNIFQDKTMYNDTSQSAQRAVEHLTFEGLYEDFQAATKKTSQTV